MTMFIETDFSLIREHESLNGFFYPPFKTSPQIVVNELGEVRDAVRLTERSFSDSTKGYQVTFVKIQQQNYNFPVHRLVAFTFIERPERHLDKHFQDLQVNHKDGDKKNNNKSNLEWVDSVENMLHARILGLFSNDVKVLARNIKTNEITTFRSISYCARVFLISCKALSFHLKNIYAGRIIVNDHVFKKDDGKEWPTIISHYEGEEFIGYKVDIVAENLEQNKVLLTNSLVTACKELDLNINVVKNNRTRKGVDYPNNGWVFYPLEDYILLKEVSS